MKYFQSFNSFVKKTEEPVLAEGNAFLAARAKAIKEDAEEFEFNGKTFPVIKERAVEESAVNEDKFDGVADLTKALHFETDSKKAEEMKIELGKRQGEVTRRKQIEGGEYSLRRFRKEIKYGDGKDLGVFLPGSYAAATSSLGDGPHAKRAPKVKWNQKKYAKWLEDVASNDGWKNAFDMAQNAKHEPGLLDWAKKQFRGEDVMQRIQWDIEAFAESVVTEAKLKFKVGDFIKQKKGGKFEYEIKSIDPKFDGVELYLDVTGQSTKYTFKHINKEWELAESVVTEANTLTDKWEKEEAEFKRIIADSDKRVYDLVDYVQFSTGGMTEKDWEKFMYGRYKKNLQSTDLKTKEKMYSVLQKMVLESEMISESATEILSKDIQDAEYHIAHGDGTSIEARSTKKTWDDGVPVLKYIARGKKQMVKTPKGSFELVVDKKYGWYYWENNGTWYGANIEYGATPPFEF